MKTINLKSVVAVACFFLAGTTISFAQEHHHEKGEKHEHKAPHGGIAKSAGNYQVEMVKSAYICPMKCKGSESEQTGKCPVCRMDLVYEGKVKFYLLDEKENTLNVSKATGKAIFQFKDGTQTVKKLEVYSDEHLWTKLSKDSMKFHNAIVTINTGKDKITAKFGEPAAHGEHQH